MWTLVLPLRIQVSKKKHFALNLNEYRNAHFLILNKAKVNFAELAEPLIRHLPPLGKICITYTLFMPTKRLADTANICSIVDKFFSDVLVSAGKLTDDNYEIVPAVLYQFGGVDRVNPRVEAKIEPVGSNDNLPTSFQLAKPKDTSMKITIVQIEIEKAIRAYIQSQIQVVPGHAITMELRATRGDEGFIANIDISPDGSAPVEVEQPKTATAVARPASTSAIITKPSLFTKPALVAVAVEPTDEVIGQVIEQAHVSDIEQPALVEAVEEEVVAHAPVEEVVEEESPLPDTPVNATSPGRDTVDEEDEELSEAERPLRASIFSGLRRPVNAPTEAEAVLEDA